MHLIKIAPLLSAMFVVVSGKGFPEISEFVVDEDRLSVRERNPCVPLKGSPLCMPKVNFGTGSSTHSLSNVSKLTSIWLDEVDGFGVDTAFNYFDEKQVGKGIANSAKSREEVFLTTKVGCDGYESSSEQALDNRKQLNLEYVDLLLIHNRHNCSGIDRLNGTWGTLVDEYKAKHARTVGVSNFNYTDFLDLEKLYTSDLRPVVNQIQMHIGCMPSNELVAYCKKKNIILEAYSPLGKGRVLKNDVVRRIATKYNRTAPQVAVNYLLQKGHIIAFTAHNPAYMKEDLRAAKDPFRIIQGDMNELDNVKLPC
eukprot:CAMPEP_0203752212 /NCGR_PEP_ID=MMETSP0098-20131031/6162_1 /ASSEMBLY_ACC=CAM_ASM_000208 /TAXON_ID=96639 /ORGANISM=" , Strain NY0313808BC1" /LENGTH=310 /DNA_ID=CAMNT_0050642269 /DNA_START=1623 /DNA_END=2555 /DNA_ORIENTATION=+